jgi:Cof subfamily protein (haloacid dehalogenase superfamily)
MVRKSEIKVVALDVDGTLAGADHKVSARAAATLERLQRTGVLPVIVTGRTETAALAVSKASRLTAPVVSCNGAVVTDPCSGARLLLSTLDPEMVDRSMAFAAAHHLEVVLWTAEEMFAAAPTQGTALLEAINQQAMVITSLNTVPRNDLIKIMLSGTREHLDQLHDQLAIALPSMKRSLDTFCESSNPDATKWEGLSFVLNRLGCPPEACIGVADGDTDVGWLTQIGVPVAVENARPAVQAIASLRIGHHTKDSVAEFLESYFELPADHDDLPAAE